jgi:aminomethyltransferase
LQELFRDEDLGAEALPYFGCRCVDLDGFECFLARTGYTGELGFELNFPAEFALSVWERLSGLGARYGLRPCGGMALQSLRIEKAYRNYGNDISTDTNPVEAGLAWVVKPDGRTFVGRDAILRAQERPLARKLLNLWIESDEAPSVGDAIVSEGRRVGRVTSAVFGPTIGAPVAMAYVRAPFYDDGAALEVVSAWGEAKARRCHGAFYDPSGSRLLS